MVEKCKESGFDVSFCGIYGSSDEPESKFELFQKNKASIICLLYTSDAADDSLRVDLGGRRIIKK